MRIIEARLQRFLEPFSDLELVRKRRHEDALFPLGEAWREQYFQNRIEIRPRDAINWAREGWRQQQESLGRHDPLDWLTTLAQGRRLRRRGARGADHRRHPRSDGS